MLKKYLLDEWRDVKKCCTEHKVNETLGEGEIHFALEHERGFLEDKGFDQKPEEWVDQRQARLSGERRENGLKGGTEHMTSQDLKDHPCSALPTYLS